MSTIRKATFDLLRNLGMTTIFGNPGTTELPLLKDFPEDFRYVLGLHEGTVVGMADGFAQGTGNAAFVNLHAAPGLGNAVGAIVTAYHNRTPLVITAGQQDRRHMAYEPLLFGHLVEMARPYSKWSHEPPRAEDVPGAIERAYHEAMQVPRGPTFVSVPMNDWEANTSSLPEREVVFTTAPDRRALARTGDILSAARRPGIVAGPGIDRSGAWDDVVRLAEKLRARVWASPRGSRAGFPQDHPLFRGYLISAQASIAEQLSGCDVVLVMGAPVFLYLSYNPGPVVMHDTKVVHITEDPSEAARAATGLTLVGDLAQAARFLIEFLPEAERPNPSPTPEPPHPMATTPLSVEYVLHALAHSLPNDAIVVDESSSSKAKLQKHVRINRPSSYFSAASGGLGFGMSAAVGLQLATPEQQVVCVVGDGSAMYTPQSIWSAARYGAAVAFVVINNGHYAALKSFGRLIDLPEDAPGLDLPGLDIVRVAEGFGACTATVSSPEELPGAFKAAFDADVPYLLNVLVDPTVPESTG
jgi:benzoylformate decarboxylase